MEEDPIRWNKPWMLEPLRNRGSVYVIGRYVCYSSEVGTGDLLIISGQNARVGAVRRYNSWEEIPEFVRTQAVEAPPREISAPYGFYVAPIFIR